MSMAYQLKITLREIDPPIWRRLKVPGTITFAQLHSIIQAAFGWLDYHLYRFECNRIIVAEKDPEFTTQELWGDGAECLEPGDTSIGTLFEAHDRCLYEYDFGDSWQHDIAVEKRLKENKKNQTPLCIAGARHRPPEDVGGVGGYEDFLRTIREGSASEREEMFAWAQKDAGGRLFDPEYFHLGEINRKLEHVLEDTPELARLLFISGGGLSGTFKAGWYGPIIEVEGKHYTWERLGVLLSKLEDEVPITIKVGRRPAGRR